MGKKSGDKIFQGRHLGITGASILMIVLAGCAIAPQPLAPDQQKALAAADRKAALADVEPLAGPLTLPEALARALKYNLDHRTHMMEEALAVGQLDLSRYDMLPRLTAAAGYDERDSDRITRSKDSVTGLPSLANPYISSDRDHTTEDLGLTWNVLDFGVSYYNAKQNADRVLVANERRRKSMHNLMQDVRTAYWRAASAQKIDTQLRATMAMAEDALKDSRKVEDEKLRDPLEALRYQRSLLENLRILESIQRELAASRIELAALINLPPGASFELAEPASTDLTPPRASLSIDRMEELAIANNADLKEQFYDTRIIVAETKKSILRLFPSLSFDYSYKHDSDSYLINKNWQEAGVQLSWNLLSLLSAPSVMRYSEANEKLAEQRRMATQMAVLAQVHLAQQQYDSAYILFERADSIWQVDQRIYEHSANREAAEIKSRLDSISNNTSAIVSYLRRFQALSQVYAASSKVEATLGLEPEIGDLQAIKLTDLTKLIATDMQQDSWSKSIAAPETAGAAPASVATTKIATASVVATPVVAAPAAVAATPANEKPVQTAAAKPAPTPPQDASTTDQKNAKVIDADSNTSATPALQHFYLAGFAIPKRAPVLNWQNVKTPGVDWVTDQSAADAVVNGKLILGKPAANGRRDATVEWTVTDPQGKPLKQVSHVGSVAKPATGEDWRVLKRDALQALSSGVAK